jgi:ubiquinone/menaquinone biosynthesis C-methylase UbiE
MIEVAEATSDDQRLRFSVGVAENLPHPDAAFDLVVSTTSFDHLSDQRSERAECVRVTRSNSQLVLDLASERYRAGKHRRSPPDGVAITGIPAHPPLVLRPAQRCHYRAGKHCAAK